MKHIFSQYFDTIFMLGDLENVEVVRFAIIFQFYQYLMFDISSEKKTYRRIILLDILIRF